MTGIPTTTRFLWASPTVIIAKTESDSHDQEPTVYRHELRFDADCPVLEVFPAPGREYAERQQRSSCRDPPTAIRWSRKSGCPSTEPLNIGDSWFGSLAPFDLTAYIIHLTFKLR
jgi:hypothetical protein